LKYLALLVRFCFGIRHVAFLVEIDHDLWSACPPPGKIGNPKLVFCARLRPGSRRTKAFPEDADNKIAIRNAEPRIYEPLRPFRMETWKRVRLPSCDLKPETKQRSNSPIQFLCHLFKDVPFDLNVAWGGDNNTQGPFRRPPRFA